MTGFNASAIVRLGMTDTTAIEQRKANEDYAATLRALIRHEDEVSNQRTTWLMVTQGILFAAVSATRKDALWAVVTIAMVGVLVTLSIGHALSNSYLARRRFKDLWLARVNAGSYAMEDVPLLDGGYPGNEPILWLLPCNFIPKVFAAARFSLIGHAVW